MSSRRTPRAMVLALIAVIIGAPLLAGLAAAPARAADPGPNRMEALRRVREGRPATLRGVLAGIARRVATGQSAPLDLRGLLTRRTAAGVTLVAVTIRADAPALGLLLGHLERLGVDIANRNDSAVEAYLAPAVLQAVARLPGVEAVEPILPTILTGLVGEGVTLHGAGTWQSAGYLATGVKVGIIDGGFTGISARLGVELPTTVRGRCYSGVGTFTSNLSDCEAEGIDHGTAVAETVVDMAPGVSLYVANPFSLQDYERTVTWMTSNGVRIINASLATSYQGPGDGSDPTGASLYTVVAQASAAGVLWVNSAGNSGENGWLGPWSDPDGDDFLDFSGDDEGNGMDLAAGQGVIVTARWNDTWGRSKNDYDIGVFDPAGALIASSVDTQDGNDDPVETLFFEAPVSGTYEVVATHHVGAHVSRFQLLVLTGGASPLEHRDAADTIPSPVDSKATGLLTVGAVDVASPQLIQGYSSRGPTVDNRIKPDLVAGDCGTTTSIGTFCGTSQSAPHVTGAAALVLDAFPSYTAQQVAAYLRSHAVALGGATPNNTYGHGRLDLGAPPGPPVPVGLEFQAQPSGAVEGAPLATQPVVRIVGADGVTVSRGPGANLPITLALGANPGEATLACPGGLTLAAVAGVAAFSGCSLDRPGVGYTLVAASGGLAGATSAPLTITGAPVVLGFAAQPSDGAAGQALTASPVVRITNGAGGMYATGARSTLPVTLAIGANAAGATLACPGGTTVAAEAGIATFTGCTIQTPGGGYTLVASAPGATPAVTGPFTLADPSGRLSVPVVTMTASESAIRWGTPVSLSVRLTTAADGAALAGRAVRVQATLDGITWEDVPGTLVTDAAGLASLAYRPATNLYYRAAFAASDDLAAATSDRARVTVRQLSALRPTNSGKVKVVPRRTQVAFLTTVRPSRPNVPPGDVTLQAFRMVGTRWTLVTTEVATPDAAGIAMVFVSFNAPGKWYVRTQANPTTLNANSGWSPIERYDVL